MPQNITLHVHSLVEAAEREIKTISAEHAMALHGRGDAVLVDLRDIRELQREGKVPGAFHCPRGMLEFWIDPESKYHKPIFASDKLLLCSRPTLGAGNPDGAADGTETGGPHRRRLR